MAFEAKRWNKSLKGGLSLLDYAIATGDGFDAPLGKSLEKAVWAEISNSRNIARSINETREFLAKMSKEARKKIGAAALKKGLAEGKLSEELLNAVSELTNPFEVPIMSEEAKGRFLPIQACLSLKGDEKGLRLCAENGAAFPRRHIGRGPGMAPIGTKEAPPVRIIFVENENGKGDAFAWTKEREFPLTKNKELWRGIGGWHEIDGYRLSNTEKIPHGWSHKLSGTTSSKLGFFGDIAGTTKESALLPPSVLLREE